eukprot:3865236-Amphidinium_carterae.1
MLSFLTLTATSLAAFDGHIDSTLFGRSSWLLEWWDDCSQNVNGVTLIRIMSSGIDLNMRANRDNRVNLNSRSTDAPPTPLHESPNRTQTTPPQPTKYINVHQ